MILIGVDDVLYVDNVVVVVDNIVDVNGFAIAGLEPASYSKIDMIAQMQIAL